MQEIIEALRSWHARGEQLALATVTRVYGSAPRPAGAMLVVSGSGAMVGSVSGGCVEAAVMEACLEAIATQRASAIEFGISDEWAWDVGLACGGTIAIFIEPLSARSLAVWLDQVPALLAQARPWSMAVLLTGLGAGLRWLIAPDIPPPADLDGQLAAQVDSASQDLLAAEESALYTSPASTGEQSVFISSHPLAPHLIIVGGVHIATVLCICAKQLGFQVSIVDPRAAFASSERFPQADALINAWPQDALPNLRLDSTTYLAVLTHDPKLDDPAILLALQHPVAYIGVLGSRATQRSRQQRLRELGVSEDELGRISGPIGLPLGGRTPAEIAISILAEMIAVRHGRRLQ